VLFVYAEGDAGVYCIRVAGSERVNESLGIMIGQQFNYELHVSYIFGAGSPY
jgi:hypothetical protein